MINAHSVDVRLNARILGCCRSYNCPSPACKNMSLFDVYLCKSAFWADFWAQICEFDFSLVLFPFLLPSSVIFEVFSCPFLNIH